MLKKFFSPANNFDEFTLVSLLNNLDTCIYVNEIENDRILFINKKMSQEFGGKDLTGKVCWQVLQDGFTERCSFCPTRKLKKLGDKVVWEEHNTVTGKHYHNTDSLIRWVDGSIVHMQHSVDITEHKTSQKEVTEALAKLEFITNNYPGVIIGLDANRKFALTSGRMLTELGFTSEGLIGKDFEDLGYKKPEHEGMLDAVYSGESFDWTDELKDNINLHCFFTPLKEQDGNITGALFVANDMSEPVRLQKELQNAITAAEKASKAKGDFLSRMSHEIRTPMNAIIGMAEIAKSTEDIEKIKSCFHVIDTSSNHLLELINDILDISKIEADKLVIENKSFDLEELAKGVSEILLDKAEEKKIQIDVFLESKVCTNLEGDKLRLSQVLTNFLSNAIKFTPEGGKISLNVEGKKTKEGYMMVRFSVTDAGIGIAEDHQERIFNSFEQADKSTTRKYGGTGLGLAICKGIVNAMGGKIWVESKLGKGSKFSFEVELKIAQDDTSQAILDDKDYLSNLKVLVVDDCPSTRRYFLDIMDKFGISTDAAQSGSEAIEFVNRAYNAQKKYSVIFLDWQMPEMDGIEVARHIKEKIDKDTAIIMISSSKWTEFEHLAKDAGINRYIPKPLFASVIFNTINEVSNGKVVQKATSPATQEVDFSELSMLLVDDIKINRDICVAFLEPTGMKIDQAKDGLEAIQMFQENPHKYDLIMMDIQMPNIDGYESTMAIRALEFEKAKSIPIIAMSANVFKEDIDNCIKSGMNDHISKPISKERMVDKIMQYTGNFSGNTPDDTPDNGLDKASGADLSTFLPYIDTEDMKARLGEDAMEFYPSLLEEFLENSSIKELESKISQGDLTGAKSAAHMIKGLASNLSLAKLYENSKEFEMKIVEQTYTEEDMEEIKAIASTTREYIQKFIEVAAAATSC